MTRTLLTGLTGLTAAAVLAVLAAPADAQQLRKQGGAHTSHSGGMHAARGHGSAQPMPQGAQRLRGNQHNAADIATHMHVYAYQLHRKKHDSLLPIE